MSSTSASSTAASSSVSADHQSAFCFDNPVSPIGPDNSTSHNARNTSAFAGFSYPPSYPCHSTAKEVDENKPLTISGSKKRKYFSFGTCFPDRNDVKSVNVPEAYNDIIIRDHMALLEANIQDLESLVYKLDKKHSEPLTVTELSLVRKLIGPELQKLRTRLQTYRRFKGNE